jgi:hypothetical protein
MQGPVGVSGNPQAYLRHLAPKEQLGSKRGLGDGPKLHRPTGWGFFYAELTACRNVFIVRPGMSRIAGLNRSTLRFPS